MMKILRDYRANRRGSTLTVACILLIALLAFTALAVDAGYLYFVKAGLQATADAAALAGAGGLGGDPVVAIQRAKDCALKNKVNGTAVGLQSSDVQLGLWDPTAHVFTPASPSASVEPNAVRVIPWLSQTRGTAVNLFFAGAVGYSKMDVKASATATFCPRDVVVVLDYSHSMCYDSSLRPASIDKLTASAVENNLGQIYQDLGSPRYGTGAMTLDGITIAATDYQTIMNKLGLQGVAYPFPGANDWSGYFGYVQGASSQRGQNLDDKHKHVYGYKTLMSYLQETQPRATQTPDLWKTHEQPVTSVKDGVSVFLAYLQQVKTDDRVGLVSFTYTDSKAKLEEGLTSDLDTVETMSRHLQAGHYNGNTNIAAGLQTGLQELQSHGRQGALQLLVLLSDGVPNLLLNGSADNSANCTNAQDAARTQARAAGAANIPIITISLGSIVDPTPLDPSGIPNEGQLAYILMQDIADLSGGKHFHVERGHSVDEYRDQLMAIFAAIAAEAPLKLVD